MNIALPYLNEEIYGHFGHAEAFKIYTVENNKIVSSKLVKTNGKGHSAMAAFLNEQGVSVLICGGIGDDAKAALAKLNIQICAGVKGRADDAIFSYLAGTLDYTDDATCDHHDEEGEHDCCSDGGCEGECSGCGGGCGGCSGCGTPEPLPPCTDAETDGSVIAVTKDNFNDVMLNHNYLIVVDFWAEWCGPCSMYAPTFEDAAEKNKNVVFCRVNVDEEPEIASMFRIRNIPTTAFLRANMVTDIVEGVHTEEGLAQLIEKNRQLV